jgi:hypothetical protein
MRLVSITMRLVASGLVNSNKTLAMTCVKKTSRNPVLLSSSYLLLFCLRVVLRCLVLSCTFCVLILGIIHPIHSVATLSCIRCVQALSVRLHALLPPCSFRFRTPLYLSLSLSLAHLLLLGCKTRKAYHTPGVL